MKKIPTIFERDWNGIPSRVLDAPNPDCAWVFAGEGIATRKIDGTCCLVRDGRLYKRREVKLGEPEPDLFEVAEYDETTSRKVGWIPVGGGAEDRWHREAWSPSPLYVTDGNYELIGPRINGNPERVEAHILVRHGEGIAGALHDVPRDFYGLRGWLLANDVEGIVFRHADGRLAKIKGRDFGIKRRAPVPTEAVP